VLPGLVRTDAQLHDSRALQIVAFPDLPPGLALLDAPDIDSVDDANRSLARQLLLAADLWLFVTSAARYADAVPWDYLAAAAERNTVVAVIVNRCPPGAVDEVAGHLAQMLAERGPGLGQAVRPSSSAPSRTTACSRRVTWRASGTGWSPSRPSPRPGPRWRSRPSPAPCAPSTPSSRAWPRGMVRQGAAVDELRDQAARAYPRRRRRRRAGGG
jgi:hypothetical protein